MGNYRFNGVPQIQYNEGLLTDLSNNLDISWTEGNTFFINYVIQEGDTQENIAYRLWNDSSLSWVISFVNIIIDPFFDWPLLPDELMEYVKLKYGRDQVYAPHHYVKKGYIVNRNDDDKDVHVVSNYEFEAQQNDEKRNIILPTDEFMQQFLEEWSQL